MIDEQAVHLAATYLDTGRPERALEELAPLIASDPDRPELLVLAAQAAALVGEHAQARELAERAVALAPESVLALLVLSQVDAASGRALPAARAAAAAVRLAPADWRTHAQAVRVDLGAGTVYRTTVDAAAAMLRLAPERPEAHALAGHLAATRHRPAAAGEHFRAALAIDPTFGGAQEGLALLAAGRLRFGPAVETASSRLAADPTDRVGKRLLDAMTTRLVLPALIGPPLIAFATWRATRPSEVVPEAVWAERTMLGDYPAVLLLPVALVVWIALQAVLLHRATRGAVWRDVRVLPARGAAVVLLVVGTATIVSTGVLASAPVAVARQVLLLEAVLALVAFVATFLVTGARVGRPGAQPAGGRRVEVRARALVGLALLAGPLAPGLALGAAGRSAGTVVLGPSLLSERPWTGGAVAIVVLTGLLLLVGAHVVSRGGVWPAIRRSSRFGLLVAAALVDAVSVTTTVLALLQPVRLGGLLIALLLVGWALVVLVGLLVLSRSRRLARRI